MLKLRLAEVVKAGPADGSEQTLVVKLAGAWREAIAHVDLVGPCRTGDEVVVNVEARDLGLGSGGFDIVHANLTRGLEAEGASGAHVMKLNYTSLQHPVEPVDSRELALPLDRPVAALGLHGQLAPVAWAFAQRAPGRRLGYVQTPGGALPAGHSRVAARLRDAGTLAGHLTAGAAFGGPDGEAISVPGAIHHGLHELGWDAAVAGPGPGVVGSGSALGHGGMAALEIAHAALALGAQALVVARMSSSDLRPRHRGISHHTLTVLELALAPVVVAVPAGVDVPAGESASRLTRHDWRQLAVDLPGYEESGLPSRTMGRSLSEDPLFFAAALAAGAELADMLAAEEQRDEDAE